MNKYTVTRTTAPATEPVTLEDAKAWMRIDIDDDDALITSLIVAAREYAEKYLGRALVTQTWKYSLDMVRSRLGDDLGAGWYDMPVSELFEPMPRVIDLPYKPLISITSVTTYSPDNTSAVYSASNYIADTANGRLVLDETAAWPSPLRDRAAIEVVYVTGYGSTLNVPDGIKTAIKMHAQKMYDERIICELPQSAMSLLNMYRVYG
jgi:hypothetical protein